MLSQTDLLSVRQRMTYNVLKIIYKAEYNRLPIYLCNMLSYVSESQPYLLRNNNDLRLPRAISSYGQNSVMYNGVKIYNNFKQECNVTNEFKNVKEQLMTFVKNEIM